MTRNRDWAGGLAEGAMVSSRLVGSVVSGAGIGWLLDRWLGTWPWLVGLGATGGSLMGFYWMVVYAREGSEDRDTDRG